MITGARGEVEACTDCEWGSPVALLAYILCVGLLRFSDRGHPDPNHICLFQRPS